MYALLSNLAMGPNLDNLKLDPNTFRAALSENIVFITKAFQNRLVIPAFEAFCENITEIYHKLKLNDQGEADPFLKKHGNMDDKKFGIAVCTVDGQRFSIGDATVPFTMQSLSRTATYGITLNELKDEVHKYQGREVSNLTIFYPSTFLIKNLEFQPSGRKTNEIVLDHNSKLSKFSHNVLPKIAKICSPYFSQKFREINVFSTKLHFAVYE